MNKIAGGAPLGTSLRNQYIQNGNALYYREANGNIRTTQDPVFNSDTVQLYSPNLDSLGNFIVYTLADPNQPAGNLLQPGPTELRVLRNGAVYNDVSSLSAGTGGQKVINQGPFNDNNYPLSSGTTVVTYEASQSGWSCPSLGNGVYRMVDQEKTISTTNGPCFTDARNNIYLHRFVDDSAIGSITDYVVKEVTVNDGYQSYTTAYTFDANSADYSGFTSSGLYQEAIVHFGGIGSNNGWTRQRFFNTNSNVQVEVCDYDLANTPPTRQNCSDHSSNEYYGPLTGLPFRTEQFDGSNTMTAKTETKYRVLKVQDGTKRFFRAEPAAMTRTLDTVSRTTTYAYDPYFQRRSSTVATTLYNPLSSSATTETMVATRRYAYEDYPAMKTANILTPVSEVTTSRKIGGGSAETISGRKIIYKLWNSDRGWLSEKTQRLDREAGQSTSVWTNLNTVVRNSTSGVVVKSTDIDGMVSSSLLAQDGTALPYASYVNADFNGNTAGYLGFEFYEPAASGGSNHWFAFGGSLSSTIAHSGAKSYGTNNGTAQVALSSYAKQRQRRLCGGIGLGAPQQWPDLYCIGWGPYGRKPPRRWSSLVLYRSHGCQRRRTTQFCL